MIIPNSINRVLVVENDKATRERLLQLLESSNYRATGVRSIAETLQLPDLADYKAILVDSNLPDGTADDLLERIQSIAPEASSVVVTGKANIGASIEALRHGAVDYLVKPINPNCLRASMARIEMLRESRKRIASRERLATVGQAVTSVAHESRNALQRIQAKAELLELELADDPEKLADLRVIKQASQSLRCMFEELRQFAAPIVLNWQKCKLREIIYRAWQSLETMPEFQFASLKVDWEDVELSVDPMRLEQVFRNLFENALAACTPAARIEIFWSESHHLGRSMLRIVVRDDGPGFDREQREKAFEPFFTTKKKGTGLGLPICNRILQQHHGWLEISPTAASGGCMVIMLPMDQQGNREPTSSPEVCEVA